MHTFFAQRHFFANAVYVSAAKWTDGVRFDLHVPSALRRPFKMPQTVYIADSSVVSVYRCGLSGGKALLVMTPESGVPPTMVSWRVVGLFDSIGSKVSRATVSWCRDVLRNPDLYVQS